MCSVHIKLVDISGKNMEKYINLVVEFFTVDNGDHIPHLSFNRFL